MYRARVEAVSGLKVRAGGKWLTCIGNRTVKAGDMIWTDGRCVYGHDREAQTPLVIVPPDKEEWGVPVQLSTPAGSLFIFRKNKLDTVGQLKQEYRSAILLNDTKGRIYSSTAAAANCDNEKNLYEIDGSDAHISDGSFSTLEQNRNIHIKKNGITVKDIQVMEFVSETARGAREKADYVYNYENTEALTDNSSVETGLHISAFVAEAFIENDKLWNIVYNVTVQATTTILYEGIDGPATNGGATFDYFYYIDSNGRNALIAKHDEWDISGNYVAPVYSSAVDYPDLQNVKNLFQDGYYSKMKPPSHGQDIPYCEHECYSPDGELLFSYEADVATRFTVCQITPDYYLVGIKPMTQTIFEDGSVWGQGGLFICEKGVLTPLSDIDCQNYCLRKAKDYRKWLKRARKMIEEAR